MQASVCAGRRQRANNFDVVVVVAFSLNVLGLSGSYGSLAGVRPSLFVLFTSIQCKHKTRCVKSALAQPTKDAHGKKWTL